MKKQLSIIFVGIFYISFLYSQQYNFFKGDSLKNFDHNATWNEISAKGIASVDIPGFFYHKQVEFVAAKYNLTIPSLQPKANFKNNNNSANPIVQGPCTNMDFENGSLNGWNGYKGDNYDSQQPLSNMIAGFVPGPNGGVNQPPSSCNRHTLVAGNTLGNDACGGFPTLSPLPNSNNSVLLNSTCYNFASFGFGASLEQMFTVAQSNALLTIAYAVVLEDGGSGHGTNEQPYFRAEVLDALGNPINCLAYNVVAQNGGSPGFILSNNCGSWFSGVYYKPWTIASFNLSQYVGQNVTVRFTASSCAFGGHYGYAYVDAVCSPMTSAITASAPVVCGTTNVVLTAPAGASNYAWSVIGGQGNIVGTTTNQNVTINQGGHYQVLVTPSTGAACAYTLDTIIPGIPISPIASFSATSTCIGATTQFTDLSSPAGSITAWYWDFDGNGSIDDTQQNPTYLYSTPGTKQVRLSVEIGPCTKDTVISVLVSTYPGATATNTGPYCAGTAAMLDVVGNGVSYQWKGPMGFNTTVQNPVISNSTVNMSGVYSVTVVNSDGCISTGNTTLAILPAPVADFTVDKEETQLSDPTITFTNLSSDTIQNFVWFFGDGATSFQTHPKYAYPQTGEFVSKIVLINEVGCKDSMEKVIRINAEVLIFAPNSFTPNGDTKNEEFEISAYGISSYNLKIFNRWGELLFESTDSNKHWDGRKKNGTLAEIETYVWKLVVKDFYDNEIEKYGDVTIIR
ncbi:MAG: gliding motility-associated C-terminal domain-containing protein [Bacteroidetes bacterium]|nr:gliding motility-associated C-terminal domain-containing protein [Bacteroidota bacterium]